MYRVLTVLCSAMLIITATLPGNAQQQPPKWADRKSATPGVQFTLQETNREPFKGGTRIIYQLALAGAPDDQTYQVFMGYIVAGKNTAYQQGWGVSRQPINTFWAWGLPGGLADASQITAGAYQMGWQVGGPPASVFLSERDLPALPAAGINGKTFGIFVYRKGEAVRLIVTSVDQTIKAFVEVFPFPLEARDGPCHLWAELIIGAQGRAFAFYGDGFPPGAKVLTSSHSGHEVLNGTYTILDDGSLPPMIIFPAVVGQTSGEASFTAIGPACVPVVTYQWGPPALAEQ